MNNNRKKAKKQSGKAFVASAKTQKTLAPKIQYGSNNRSRRIQFRELVASINGSIAFEVNHYSINPGMSESFPWLSVQAKGWDKYRFIKLSYEYVTRCSTATAGSIIMSPEYDPQDADPSDEKTATAKQDCVEDAAWKDIVCHLNPNDMCPTGSKFIRNSNVAGDPRSFDSGSFNLCTVEMAGASAVGKLWVSYIVELSVPNIEDSVPSAGRSSILQLRGGAQALVSTVSEPIEYDAFVSNGLRLTAPATGVFTLPAGAYNLRASASVQNTGVELTTIKMEIWKNGAALADPIILNERWTTSATEYRHCVIDGYLSCNGTDTCQIQMTATGAAGALTVMNDTALLCITIA